jgi:hypothetical protein
VFSHRPERLVKLQKAGFDPNWLMYGNDQWMASGGAGSEHVTREAPAQHHAQTVESPFARRGVPEPSPHATEMAQQLAAQEQFDRQYLQGRQRLDHYADAPAQEEQGFRPEYGRGAGDDRRGGGRGYR